MLRDRCCHASSTIVSLVIFEMSYTNMLKGKVLFSNGTGERENPTCNHVVLAYSLFLAPRLSRHTHARRLRIIRRSRLNCSEYLLFTSPAKHGYPSIIARKPTGNWVVHLYVCFNRYRFAKTCSDYLKQQSSDPKLTKIWYNLMGWIPISGFLWTSTVIYWIFPILSDAPLEPKIFMCSVNRGPILERHEQHVLFFKSTHHPSIFPLSLDRGQDRE